MAKNKTAPDPSARKWRNRIIGHAEVDPNTLLANPKNWRSHPDAQIESIDGILNEVGWVQSVIVNKRTNFIVDGHARVGMAIARGELVPVVYVDLTDEEEAKVLASFDTLALMGVADGGALASLVSGIEMSAEPLDNFIASLVDASTKTSLEDVNEAPESQDGRASMGKSKERQVKAVLFVKDLITVERALRAAGEINRGKALVEICKHYLANRPDEMLKAAGL